MAFIFASEDSAEVKTHTLRVGRFYGGTCLRIFHGMKRFSEDMDFSLVAPLLIYDSLFCITDLYAGKMHALVFRNWRSRVKGRDWYDFEWYVRN